MISASSSKPDLHCGVRGGDKVSNSLSEGHFPVMLVS